MDSLTWHTINGHRLVLKMYKSKIYKDDNNKFSDFLFDSYRALKKLDRKWFTGTNDKLNYEERYDFIEFDSKQFYKEFIECIEPCLPEEEFRDIRIKKLLHNDIYNRSEIEKHFLRSN